MTQLIMRLVMRRPAFCMLRYAKTKMLISWAITTQLISAFVLATYTVQSSYFLNPKFQVSSHLLWLYGPVCVGPGWKLRTGFLATWLMIVILKDADGMRNMETQFVQNLRI